MKLVIVGAGQAGAWAARTARQLSGNADITLIGDEPDPPYERPPLSKAYLAGQNTLPSLLTPEMAIAQNIRLQINTRVQKISAETRSLELHDGHRLNYDRLILTTGGRARLPDITGIGSPGVHTLRTRRDADQLRAMMRPGARLLIIGGGWIGLEVAATATQQGLSVTVLEQQSRLCGRTVPPQISDYLLQLHQAQGVSIHLNSTVSEIYPGPNGTLNAHTATQSYSTDLILVGAGLIPNTELAEAAGLDVDNGILVNDLGRSSDSHIYAAGDVANPALGSTCSSPQRRQRLETWANAQQQGIRVAHAVLNHLPEPTTLPWFWSDQYFSNIQVLGCPAANSAVTQRGQLNEHDACLYYWQDQEIQGVIAINRPRELKLAKRLIQSQKFPTPDALADPSYAFGKSMP